MRDVFQLLAMRFCLVGLGVTVLAWLVRLLLSPVVRRGWASVRAVGRKGLIPLGFLSLFVGVLVVCGSTKEDSGTNAPPPRVETVLEVPAHVGTNAFVRVEKWWLRGAWEDGETVAFPDGWCFPYGSNHLTCVEIWSQGSVYPSEKATEAIASMSLPLALEPGRTQVVHGRTTNNSYRVEWRDAHPNRDAFQVIDAAIELFRNGNVLVEENGMSTLVPYVIPFAHDGFGQDESWVRANFADYTEILALGYTNWVDEIVGGGPSDSLYKFTAVFVEAPPEPLLFQIDGYAMAVTNAGEYAFLLAKGENYWFDLWPSYENVVYRIQDGVGEHVSITSVSGDGRDGLGASSSSDGRNLIYPPMGDYPGYTIWLPASSNQVPPDTPSEGTNASSRVSLSLDIPRGIPVGGPALAAEYAFGCEVETNGWLVLQCVGNLSRVSLWQDATTNVVFACSNRIVSTSMASSSFYVYGKQRSQTVGDVVWRLSFVPDEGEPVSVEVASTVFACYCQPVMEAQAPTVATDYNPAVVKVGTNAWFRVDTFPSLPSSEIRWDIWRGAIVFPHDEVGSRVQVQGCTAGDVVIQVNVLDYADERMRFEFDVVE